MSHPGHEIVRCSECDRVIMQCRCMDQNKPTRYMVCNDCRRKLDSHIEDVQPTPPREQKPGSGREQTPRRNEEQRPI